jgi:hypothetical protein
MASRAETVEQPWTDPIVEEVRNTRENLLAECGYDLEKLAVHLRERQRAGGREAVTLPPRAPSKGAA